MNIFSLYGSIFVDNASANKAIDDTDKKGKGLMGTFGNMVGAAVKVGAAVGAAAIGGAAALLGMATKAGNAADRLLDLNSITGMSTDEIQRWERVTKVAGVNIDAMTNASQKLTKSLNTMDSEGNKSRKAVEALGLSFANIQKMNADERMDAIVRALAAVEDKTERARLGTDLLGGSWKEIAPIVDLGAEALDKAKKAANIISKEDLEKANNFRIKMAEMRDQAGHFAMMLGISVIPIAERLFDWIEQYMPMIQEIVSQAFKFIGDGITWVMDNIIEPLTKQFDKSFGGAGGIVGDFRDKVLPIIRQVGDIILKFVEFVMLIWNEWGDTILSVVKTVFNVAWTVIETVLGVISGILDVFIGLFTGDWERMGEGLLKIWSSLWDGIAAILSGAWDILKAVFGQLWESISKWFKGLATDALGWGGDIITGLWDGLVQKWESLKGKVKGFFGGIGNMVKGVFGISSPSKMFAGFGENIVQGLAQGIEGAKSLAEKASIKLAYSVTPALAGAPAGGATSRRHHTFDPLIVKGYNDRNQLMDIVEVVIDEVRREARM